MQATIIDVSRSVFRIMRMRMRILIAVVHDEPSPDKEVFMDDVANWISAHSGEAVQVEGSKSKL